MRTYIKEYPLNKQKQWEILFRATELETILTFTTEYETFLKEKSFLYINTVLQ
jgi:hypothetical protein